MTGVGGHRGHNIMQQAVLILGMHRSGTSAIAGVSHLLGAAAPATLMQPAFDNPTGFWESEAIAGLNEAILHAAGTAWFDCLPFIATNLAARFQRDGPDERASVLAREFGDASLFVLKDPRFSLLYELWRPTFTALNVAVAPIVALRHPAEVVASLRRRDGMPADVASPLWLHYMLEAERQTRDRSRAVLSYDKLFHDWRGSMSRVTAEADVGWPISLDSAAAAIGEFLRPQLRHHYATPRKIVAGRPPIADWVADTYDALRRIEAGDRAAQFTRLDDVREQFAIWRVGAPRVSANDATAS
jgi:hypothetical protein